MAMQQQVMPTNTKKKNTDMNGGLSASVGSGAGMKQQVMPTSNTKKANATPVKNTAKQDALTRYLSTQSSKSNSLVQTTDTDAITAKGDARLEDLKGNNQDLYDSQLGQQKATIDQNTQNNINALQKAYADAVMNGELSQQEAEAQLAENMKVIQQKAYQDSQATNLNAESRGIGNSQQMMGMQASDNARTNTNITTARTERDKRINEIKTRLNSITTQKDLDVANAQNQGNMQYQQAMFGLQSELMRNNSALDQQGYASMMDMEKMKAGQQFDIGMANQNQAWTQDNMGLQQQYTKDNMATEQQYNQQNMETQQGYNIQNMGIQQGYNLQSMAKQYGYDVSKMSIQQKNDLAKMAKQQEYDVSNINQQFKNNVSLSNLEYSHNMNMSNQEFNQAKQLATHNSQLQVQQAQQEYMQARGWEQNKYQKGTPEYNIAQGQMNTEMTRIKKEIETRAMAEAVAAVQAPAKKEKKKKKSHWYDAFVLS